MIRMAGRKEDGSLVVGVVIGPENLARLATGQPLVVSLSTLVRGSLTEPIDVVIEYEPEYQAAVSRYTKQALADGVGVRVEAQSPAVPQ